VGEVRGPADGGGDVDSMSESDFLFVNKPPLTTLVVSMERIPWWRRLFAVMQIPLVPFYLVWFIITGRFVIK
jgi:hypothetical protein